ncbi:hypothetical protein E3983_07655 [Legionella israelensis]|uniref:Transglycosylase SLT domain-containing protein n=1 Tax=Legionella israelensis TaxID=454 RepID=A0AAX1EGM1_9GAMM|nr:transglycosylase SLT domain-containing protein [Legionella israelensis]QBR84246.1 hypothetical protein E3983_07655 [Legionella israelensis]
MQKITLLVLVCMQLAACVKTPPNDVNNICKIFAQYPKWHAETRAVERRWKVPVSVQMAIIHQESKFNGRAKPPRTKLLWIIPWKRPSTAYGYSQALHSTWNLYKKSEGGYWVSRDDFGDAADFIGWYAHQAHMRTGIPKNDAYKLYLAYHEGIGGYQRKTYLKKPWLIAVARKVKAKSQFYERQLTSCKVSRRFWFK